MQHPLQATLAHQGRSAAWLGRITDKSTSYVTRVIGGERRASDDFQRRASQALGVPPDMLFPPSDAPLDESDAFVIPGQDVAPSADANAERALQILTESR